MRGTVMAALVLQCAAAGAQPLPANVWVLDEAGRPRLSYGVTGATTGTRAGGVAVEVSHLGVWTSLPGTLASTSAVLVNRATESWPKGDVLPLSVVGLDAPLHDETAPMAPGVSASPPGGGFQGTLGVTLRAHSAPLAAAAPTLEYRFGESPYEVAPGPEHTIYLLAAGTYELTVKATSAALAVPVTTERTYSFTLYGSGAFKRDTDGDGLPDFWEVLYGLSPLEASLDVDSDGDGWPDFEEILRYSNAKLATSRPFDFDGDGWSDWDEERRGTDPDDPADAPVARRLYEVEGLLAGAVWADDGATQAAPGTGVIEVTGAPWQPLGLVDDATLAGWGPLRVPLSDPAIVRAYKPDEPRRVGKAWVDGAGDPTPRAVLEALIAGDASWTTPGEFQAAYQDALAEQLVREETVAITPGSGLGIALLEAVIAWRAGIAAGAPVLLGRRGAPEPVDAVAEVASGYAGGLNALHQDLAGLTAPGGPMALVADLNLAIRADLDALVESTTTGELAMRLQRDPLEADGGLARYAARLVWLAGLDALEALGVPLEEVLDPLGDRDLDALTDGEELDRPPAEATSPLTPDTDGDGKGDLGDPCPLDAADGCLELGMLKDGDLDGIPDALDNCVGAKNALQQDANGDGIGDHCEAPARIRTPAAHRSVAAGGALVFTSMPSADASLPIAYHWLVDGVDVSQKADLGSWTFTVPGKHTVVLSVSDGVTLLADADSRTIFVLAVTGPAPCAALDCGDGDPCTANACDLDLGCLTEPIPGCHPCTTHAECSDGDACTTGDACAGGLCGAAFPVDCDDGNPCTLDGCLKSLGCVHMDDPGADPILCPECAIDVDCAAGQCLGGQCCEATALLGQGFVLDPTAGGFTLCLPEGEDVSIVATGPTGILKIQVAGPDGKIVATSPNGSKKVTVDRFTTPLAGLYEVTFSIVNVPAGTEYTVTVYDVPPPATAEVITFGEAIKVPVEVPGQYAELRFTLDAGERFFIAASYLGISCVTLALSDPAGDTLVASNNSCVSYVLDTRVVDVTGEHRLTLDPNGGAVGTITVTVWKVADDDTLVLPITATPVMWDVLTPGQAADFQISGTAGQRLALITTGHLGACVDYVLRSPSGAVIFQDLPDCGGFWTDVLVLPETGTYLLHLDPRSTWSGAITATAYDVPPDPETTISIGGPGATLVAEVPGQNPRFHFAATGTETVVIQGTWPGASICGTWSVIAPDGTEVAKKSNTCKAFTTPAIALTQAGTYTLLADLVTNRTGPVGVSVQ